MSKLTITPDKLGAALSKELTVYHEDVLEGLRGATRESLEDLVKRTRATAPKKTGRFRKQIAGDFRGLARGGRKVQATWYVKAPDYRRTHLLVHGHATRNGGRTTGDPFLKKALDAVLPEYERKVEEVLKNGK